MQINSKVDPFLNDQGYWCILRSTYSQVTFRITYPEIIQQPQAYTALSPGWLNWRMPDEDK